jgi:hypothetical protein
MRRGTTWDEFKEGEISHLFRRQGKRDLDEIDTLIAR